MLDEERYRSLTCDEYESAVGIGAYYTQTRGIGGLIKVLPEDFEVWEVLNGGLDARERFERWRPPPYPPVRNALLVVKKRDRETLRVAADLAKILGVRLRAVKTYGLKDRRAVAWQFVAVPARSVLDRVDVPIEVRGAQALVVGEAHSVETRELLYNAFRVLVREADPDQEVLENFVREVNSRGVPNFYGLQRFGVSRPITHLVGYHLVRGDLEAAARAFVGLHTPHEQEHVIEFRRSFLESGDWSWAAMNAPKSLVYERALLRHLASNPGDFAGAFRRLPLRIRRLLVESYASYVFNRALTENLRDGVPLDEPLEGDLVARVDRFGRPERKLYEVSRWNIVEAARRVREGTMAILMPHPGHSVRLPQNERGKAILRALEQDGLRPSSFRLRDLPEAGSMGGYRAVTLRPLRISARAVKEDGVLVEMALPRGSFATVVLRELMKQRCALAYVGKRVH
ncbi:MAG: tRNA pseudouridine(13) synthase TruD [Nitrososphaerota archaeon]